MGKAFEMVRKVADGLERHRQLAEIEQRGEEPEEPVAVRETITRTMAVSIDAGKVPIRTNEQVTEEGKKSYECGWRDSKVATVSAPP